MKNMYDLNSEKGIGLLELMLSIIVITAIILGATKYYLVAREAMKITQAQDVINNVASATYKWIEGQPNFHDLTLQKLIDAGLLPGKYGQSGISPWGGSINLTPKQGDDQLAAFWFDNLGSSLTTPPSKPCLILYNKYKDSTQSSIWSDENCTFYFKAP